MICRWLHMLCIACIVIPIKKFHSCHNLRVLLAYIQVNKNGADDSRGLEAYLTWTIYSMHTVVYGKSVVSFHSSLYTRCPFNCY